MSKKDEIKDWITPVPQNPYIEYSESAKLWRCSQHMNTVKTITGAIRHSQRYHNMDRYGNLLNKNPPPANTPSPTPEQPPQATAEESEEEKEFWKPKPDDTPLMAEAKRRHAASKGAQPEQSTVEIVENSTYIETVKEITNKAVAIVSNYRLMFLYFESKRFFPPEWDFETWIMKCISQTIRSMGIEVEVKLNKSILTDDQLEYYIKNEQAWAQYIADQNKPVETPVQPEAQKA